MHPLTQTQDRKSAGIDESPRPASGLRIAIDLTAVRTLGTQLYCDNFVRALPADLDKSERVLLFLSPAGAKLRNAGLPGNFDIRVVAATQNLWARLCWEQTLLPLSLARWRADVLFAPFDIAPVACPCPVLVAIRNPGPALLKMGVRDGNRAGKFKALVHERMVNLSCRQGRLTMYPTKYAAGLLGDALDVPPERRAVVHHGLDVDYWRDTRDGTELLQRHSIQPGRYVFFASQHYRQKQTDVLIEGFGLWRRRRPGREDYKLILTGRTPDQDHWEKMQGVVDRMGLRDCVQFLGNVEKDLVRALYQSSAAFVMPSVMETFGFPYTEAMSVGRPLLCADTAIAREICGNAAVYFKAGDPRALAEGLETIVGNSQIGARLGAAAIERSRFFSWQKEARETLHLLRAVAGRMSPAAPANGTA